MYITAEISEIFELYNISTKVYFTTWNDYAIMSMVESGLGISILHQLIFQRIPLKICISIFVLDTKYKR